MYMRSRLARDTPKCRDQERGVDFRLNNPRLKCLPRHPPQLLYDSSSTHIHLETGRFLFHRRSLSALFRTRAPALTLLVCLNSAVLHASTVPAGALIEIRLQQEINSYSTQSGSPVQGVVIAPVTVHGEVLIPAGSMIKGIVKTVHRVGVGLIRETATIDFQFQQLLLPDGSVIPIATRIAEIENARESVDKLGRIRGIRSTATPGYRAAGLLTSLAAVDPIALVFSTAAFATMLRFSDPEIRFPVGTELLARIMENVEIAGRPEDATPKVTNSDGERDSMMSLVRRMPFRTRTYLEHTPSDLTNLLFAGTLESMERAFVAAGWVTSANVTAATRYKMLRALAENQSYHEAPMSVLMLGDKRPVLTFSKTLNTFSKRHHLRIYDADENWAGQPVFTAAATQDIGIGFSAKHRGFTHLIDDHIDNERAKALNDLIFTGCVDRAETLDRPWVLANSKNATGQKLITDGAIAILVLNECRNPRRFDEHIGDIPGPYRGNQALRIGRQTLLTVRNDLVRGNFVWQGVNAAFDARKFLRSRAGYNRDPRPERSVAVAGESYTADENAEYPLRRVPSFRMPAADAARENFLDPSIKRTEAVIRGPSDWCVPSVELGFGAGAGIFSNSSAGAEGVIISGKNTRTGGRYQFAVTAGNRISPGWVTGGTVTLNTTRWLSHELGFRYQRGSFRLGLVGVDMVGADVVKNLEEQSVGILTREFSYNTVFHFRPREKRFRPYVSTGPAIELTHLTDAPFLKARGLFRYGLNNVGMLKSAYNFGSAPPLEGGGIFAAGAQLGGGIKYRVQDHWMFRLDYRSTMTRRPDFLKKSLVSAAEAENYTNDFQLDPISNLSTKGRLGQQRLTMGFSFTF